MRKAFDVESWQRYCDLVTEHKRAINAELDASRAMFDGTGSVDDWVAALRHEQEARARYEDMRREYAWI